MRLDRPPASTHALDDLRARDYPLLEATGHVYLDYTAANLIPQSLVARHAALLRDHLLGNPHSGNPSSALATTFVDQARLSYSSSSTAIPTNTSSSSPPMRRRR